MKFTRYFETLHQRLDRASIQLDWIERVIQRPVREQVQGDGRIRRSAPIAEMDGRNLRVYCIPTVRQCTTRFLIAHATRENPLLSRH